VRALQVLHEVRALQVLHEAQTLQLLHETGVRQAAYPNLAYREKESPVNSLK
jgi:hypothetical protein